MKNILFSLTIFVFAFTSCKTSKEITPVIAGNTTNSIKVPAGFSWQNSRNVNFTVSVTDTRFQSSIFLISIYDGDPTTGANLLAKGSASMSTSFKSKVYTSNQINQVYIVKTSPDNSKTTQVLPIGSDNIITSIGI